MGHHTLGLFFWRVAAYFLTAHGSCKAFVKFRYNGEIIVVIMIILSKC